MLTQLNIHHLRNLQSVQLSLAQCNVFIGVNGSGKTSLLESLHLLSRGKSFRHAQPKRYISHHQPHTTVHARFSDGDSMAIQKSQDASTALRLGQQTVYVQSALARKLPTLIIDPSSMDILEVGSGRRRQLLDWVTFHVEQGFHSQWVTYQRLLKQRNVLLKQSQQLTKDEKQELAAWDKGLANHAALITHYRQKVFGAWQPLFDTLIKQLLPDYAPFIQLRFSAGYNTDLPFDDLLQQRLIQDNHLGYTRVGCHRADVQVLWVDNKETRQQVSELLDSHSTDNNDDIEDVDIEATDTEATNKEGTDVKQNMDSNDGVSSAVKDSVVGSVREQAANVLSRGEKKLLITALRLSQLPLLMNDSHSVYQIADIDENSKTVASETVASKTTPSIPQFQDDTVLPLVLLDDITAELDERALNILLKTLASLNCQIFITSLDDSILTTVKTYWQDVKVFHVEQGEIGVFKKGQSDK